MIRAALQEEKYMWNLTKSNSDLNCPGLISDRKYMKLHVVAS